MMSGIYLDNNATTVISVECVREMERCLLEFYANPSSKHAMGMEAKALLIESREKVASLINARPSEIIFTSGATESINQVFDAMTRIQPEKKHFIVSGVEHHAVLDAVRRYQASGYAVTVIPVNGEGELDLELLKESIRPETALISMIWVNNETGVIFPVEKITQIAQSKGVLLHLDATQAVGRLPIDLSELPAHFLSFSGHKIHAAKGSGVLFVRKGVKITPLFPGTQEFAKRGGTESMPSIVSLAKASEILLQSMGIYNERIRNLRDDFESQVAKMIPGIQINGERAERVDNTSSVTFPDLNGFDLVEQLSRSQIYVSSGSACAALIDEPSHVLKAMGLSSRQVRSTVRFTFSRYNTQNEVRTVIRTLKQLLSKVYGSEEYFSSYYFPDKKMKMA